MVQINFVYFFHVRHRAPRTFSPQPPLTSVLFDFFRPHLVGDQECHQLSNDYTVDRSKKAIGVKRYITNNVGKPENLLVQYLIQKYPNMEHTFNNNYQKTTTDIV